MAIIQFIAEESTYYPRRESKAKLGAAVVMAALLLLLSAVLSYRLTHFSFSPFNEAAPRAEGLAYEDAPQAVEAAAIPIPGTGRLQGQYPTPLEAESSQKDAARRSDQLELQDFVGMVYTGEGKQLTGVFASGALALPIVQQPAGQPGYISAKEGEVTQFALSAQYGSIGLLAHNYLAGENFFNVNLGQEITLVYGDGRLSAYRVTAIRRFQALSPNSPYSNFLDLDNGNKQMSMQEVFDQTYGQSSVLLLQTCIEANGLQTWGRLFVIAEPLGDA